MLHTHKTCHNAPSILLSSLTLLTFISPLMSPALISSDIFVWLGVAAGLYVAVERVTRRRVTDASLPPGPKGWPLIGNLLEVPSIEPWKIYAAWGEKWGESFTTAFEMALVHGGPRSVHQAESCPSTCWVSV